ncbi:hypothetical protein LINGRAHAP2_LOCUS32853 [Linum grandiflorum]
MTCIWFYQSGKWVGSYQDGSNRGHCQRQDSIAANMDLSAIPRHDCRIVQAELGRPSALHPDKGKVAIFLDCSAFAEPTFEVRSREEEIRVIRASYFWSGGPGEKK